eukprot:Gb_38884 [translate_table: standard]
MTTLYKVFALTAFFYCLWALPSSAQGKCDFSAIFNFGDSNSDTGGLVALNPPQNPPYGETFFHKPSGRFSDGRLTIDFIAEAMGFPYLNPYLQGAVTSKFQNGANFAMAGAPVLIPANVNLSQAGVTPYPLAMQVSRFKEFKSHDAGVITPDSYRRAIYTLDIGQNDFTSNLAVMNVEQLKSYLPRVVNQIGESLKELYGNGAKYMIVWNMGPLACLPGFLYYFADKNPDDIDEAGCFKYPHNACCGGGGKYNVNPQVSCGESKTINGTMVSGSSCAEVSEYVCFDSVHFTEAAHHHIAEQILIGVQFAQAPHPHSPLDPSFCKFFLMAWMHQCMHPIDRIISDHYNFFL